MTREKRGRLVVPHTVPV